MDNITGTIVLANEQGTITFNNTNTASGSWSFKRSIGGGGFKFGGCSIGSCSFTLYDKGSDWKDKNFWKGQLTVEINNNLYFTGIITSSNQSYNTIQITANDLLFKADELVMYGTINSIGFQSGTRADLVQLICDKIGLNGYHGLAYGNLNIPNIDPTVTCREALSYVAEASGQYCYVDSNNTLQFGWYGSEYIPLGIFGRNLSRNPTRISGVRVYAYDNKDLSKADIEVMSEYDLNVNIMDNPCITSSTYEQDFNRLNPLLKGKVFTTGSVTVKSDPNMVVGQYVKIPKYEDGKFSATEYVMLPIANVNYKPYGTSSVSCNALENQEADMRETQAQRSLDNDITNKNSKLYKALNKIASPTSLGGVKVGSGLQIDKDGTLSATGGGGGGSVYPQYILCKFTSEGSPTVSVRPPSTGRVRVWRTDGTYSNISVSKITIASVVTSPNKIWVPDPSLTADYTAYKLNSELDYDIMMRLNIIDSAGHTILVDVPMRFVGDKHTVISTKDGVEKGYFTYGSDGTDMVFQSGVSSAVGRYNRHTVDPEYTYEMQPVTVELEDLRLTYKKSDCKAEIVTPKLTTE